jgi:hypothetical protein
MMFRRRFKIKGVNNNCSKSGDCQLKLNTILLISLSIFSLNIHASTQSEIIYLLNFVASTACQYERNGNFHNGKEAFEHINKKYKYYSDEIQSTEDFIQYAASKSKMSGKYYKIHCHNKSSIKSQDWLLTELMVYRKSKK